MANDFYTLIIVPHAKAQFRKFQVSVRLLRRAAWTGGALAFVLAGVLVHYAFLMRGAVQQRRQLADYEQKKRENEEYKTNQARHLEQISQLQSVINKLGVMAGVEQTIPAANNPGGVGGVSSTESSAPGPGALKEMDRTLLNLAEKATQLESFYRDQKVLLASTPSVWPVRGYLSAGFGNRIDPFTGMKDFHPGIDISTPMGTHVLAPADGIVISVGPRGGYGNAIQIDHAYDIVTRYAHLDRFNVRPGQRVRRGELIGFVGNTGRSTAPHLHYEVWVRDQAHNPIHYILDEYRSFG
jgi:murein DD-endopeptidase MepM/ murein hydrolase activator NlpD